MAKVNRAIKKKERRTIPLGIVHIIASFNNVRVVFTDPTGGVVCWATAGQCGFKGSRKGTPFAAQFTAEDACRKAQECGMKKVGIKVQGPGIGRDAAIRAIHTMGFEVAYICDITPIPHNGCRPPKRRRV